MLQGTHAMRDTEGLPYACYLYMLQMTEAHEVLRDDVTVLLSNGQIKSNRMLLCCLSDVWRSAMSQQGGSTLDLASALSVDQFNTLLQCWHRAEEEYKIFDPPPPVESPPLDDLLNCVHWAYAYQFPPRMREVLNVVCIRHIVWSANRPGGINGLPHESLHALLQGKLSGEWLTQYAFEHFDHVLSLWPDAAKNDTMDLSDMQPATTTSTTTTYYFFQSEVVTTQLRTHPRWIETSSPDVTRRLLGVNEPGLVVGIEPGLACLTRHPKSKTAQALPHAGRTARLVRFDATSLLHVYDGQIGHYQPSTGTHKPIPLGSHHWVRDLVCWNGALVLLCDGSEPTYKNYLLHVAGETTARLTNVPDGLSHLEISPSGDALAAWGDIRWCLYEFTQPMKYVIRPAFDGENYTQCIALNKSTVITLDSRNTRITRWQDGQASCNHHTAAIANMVFLAASDGHEGHDSLFFFTTMDHTMGVFTELDAQTLRPRRWWHEPGQPGTRVLLSGAKLLSYVCFAHEPGQVRLYMTAKDLRDRERRADLMAYDLGHDTFHDAVSLHGMVVFFSPEKPLFILENSD